MEEEQRFVSGIRFKKQHGFEPPPKLIPISK